MSVTLGKSPSSSAAKTADSMALISASVLPWIIVGLLFLATTINYMDRAVLGVLKPLLDADLGWTQIDYGWVVTAFQAAYAVGYFLAGRWFDQIGVRAGLLFAVTAWSFAACGHALAHTVLGFAIARAFLGFAEGGFFPAAIKGVAEWFPQQLRALATGIFNSGSNVGAMVCPVIVPALAARWGWRGAFLLLGATGFVWVGLWIRLSPKSGRSVGRALAPDMASVNQQTRRSATSWAELFRFRQTWAYIAGTAASAPIWWFYIFWAPDFFSKRYGLSLNQIGPLLMWVFLFAGFGGIAGGWLSSFLLRRHWTVNASRKTALLVCALFAVPVLVAPLSPSYIVADVLIAFAAAAHCGYAANIYSLASDTVPPEAVASVVGIGGMVGAVAGIFFAQFIARILSMTHNNYVAPFAVASFSYLLGLAIIHLLLPKLEMMRVRPHSVVTPGHITP